MKKIDPLLGLHQKSSPLFNFFMYSGIVLYFLKGITGNSYFLYLGCFFGLFCLLNVLRDPLPNIVHIIIAIITFSYIFIIYINKAGEGRMFAPIILSSIGISIMILKSIHFNFKIHRFFSAFLIWPLILYLLFYFYLHGNIDLATEGSRNHNSTSLLLLSAYYCVVRRVNNQPISLFFPSAVFCISLLSVGTSGIISSAIFLIGSLFSSKKRNLMIWMFILTILIFNFNLENLLNSIDKELILKFSFERISGNDVRYEIIKQYLEKLDFIKFITGTPLNQLNWQAYNPPFAPSSSTNLHNSYLLMHAKMGLFSLFYLVIILLSLIKLLKKDFLLFSIFLAILLRSFSDTIAFSHGYYDWSVLLLIFTAFIYKFPIKQYENINGIKLA